MRSAPAHNPGQPAETDSVRQNGLNLVDVETVMEVAIIARRGKAVSWSFTRPSSGEQLEKSDSRSFSVFTACPIEVRAFALDPVRIGQEEGSS